MIDRRIKVTTVSFSKNNALRGLLEASFAHVAFNDEGVRFSQEQLLSYLSDADGAIVGLDQIDRSVMDRLPQLKVIAKYGVGLDNIDLASAEQLGKHIVWQPGVNRRSVAELALAMMLGLARNVYQTNTRLRSGEWWKRGGWQLTGKTVGIVGCGHIGSDLLSLLQPFGNQILVTDILDKKGEIAPYDGRQVALDYLLAESDVVSMHVPLTDQTREMINEETLSLMKPHSLLINTSRGGVVDQQALKRALARGTIAGAGIDVYDHEPPSDSEFLNFPNLVSTPHIGGNAAEAVIAMGTAAIDGIVDYWSRD